MPLLVGGDFNIIRRQCKKNIGNFNARCAFVFNAIIESLDLREIDLTGIQYTWRVANRFLLMRCSMLVVIRVPTSSFHRIVKILIWI